MESNDPGQPEMGLPTTQEMAYDIAHGMAHEMAHGIALGIGLDSLSSEQLDKCEKYMEAAYQKRHPNHSLPNTVRDWFWRKIARDWTLKDGTYPPDEKLKGGNLHETALRVGSWSEDLVDWAPPSNMPMSFPKTNSEEVIILPLSWRKFGYFI